MAFEPSVATTYASVLEDTIYQLSILGSILPVSYHGRQDSKQVCFCIMNKYFEE